MKVYQTDFSGLYVGTCLADESPLEPGVFLLPSRCVETSPPESWPDDVWPRWNGFEWVLINKPLVNESVTPQQKLAEFLEQNPDVMDLINNKS